MSACRRTISEYLRAAKQLSEQKTFPGKRLSIVLGNESCDLDSAVSALLYGFYLTSTSKPELLVNGSGVTHDSDPTVVVPILNIPAAHLPIKTEVVYFLRENSIPLDSLVFRDSLDLEQLSCSCLLSVTLVDHHVLSSHDRFLAPYVREILDHRPLLQAWSELNSKTMDIVGSCVTHVARKILDNCPEIIQDSPDIANLIYGTILLDTACLSEAAGRTTPADLAVVTQLKALHARRFQPEAQLFASLQQAKSDVTHLSAGQLLIKDLKFTNQGVPIAGLPILVREFLKRSTDLQSTLDQFLCENHACLLVLMGQRIRDGNIERDLGLYINSTSDNAVPGSVEHARKSSEMLDKVLVQLKSSTDPSLELSELDRDSTVKVFSIGNVRVSRKQVLPLVEKALES